MDDFTAHEESLGAPPQETRTQRALTDQSTRHRHGVTRLLAHRDDLRGVHAFADVLEESVRWSA